MHYFVSTSHLSRGLWLSIMNLNPDYYNNQTLKEKPKRRFKSQVAALKLLYKRGYGGVKYARQIS